MRVLPYSFGPIGPWIHSLRPTTALWSGLIAIAGFRLVEMPIVWPAVLTVFTGTMATMVENDWHDRDADVLKDKPFAHDHPGEFLHWRLICWGVCLLFIAGTFASGHIAMSVLLTGLVIMSLGYTYVYRMPLLPGLFVAIASAAPVLLPAVSGTPSTQSWLLFAAVACAVYANEIINDLEDVVIDRGRKWTWPTALDGPYYWDQSLWIASLSAFGGALPLLGLSPMMLAPASFVVMISSIALQTETNARKGRHILTTGLGLAILTIAVFAPF